MVPSSSAGGFSGPVEGAGGEAPGPGGASRVGLGSSGGVGTAGVGLESMAGAMMFGLSTGGPEPVASPMSSRLGVGVLPKDSCETEAPSSKVSCLIIVSNEVVRGR